MLFKNKKDIENWLYLYEIENYELIEDDTYGYVVNVFENVMFTLYSLKNIEVKFNIIEGSFNCSYNNLTSLEGCPEVVKGEFCCYNNNLKSLKYCPKLIETNFNCKNNELTSLKYCPEIINGDFNCSYNQLISLENNIKIINGDFNFSHNQLLSLKSNIELIKGNVNGSNNILMDLNGIPQIKGNMNFSNNQLTEDSLYDIFKIDSLKYVYLRDNLLNNFEIAYSLNELKEILTVKKEKENLSKIIEDTDFNKKLKIEKI